MWIVFRTDKALNVVLTELHINSHMYLVITVAALVRINFLHPSWAIVPAVLCIRAVLPSRHTL